MTDNLNIFRISLEMISLCFVIKLIIDNHTVDWTTSYYGVYS